MVKDHSTSTARIIHFAAPHKQFKHVKSTTGAGFVRVWTVCSRPHGSPTESEKLYPYRVCGKTIGKRRGHILKHQSLVGEVYCTLFIIAASENLDLCSTQDTQYFQRNIHRGIVSVSPSPG